MSQTIQDFYQTAQYRKFSRDFQLRVEEFKINGEYLFDESDLVYIKTATLPSKKIETVQAPYMGLKFNVPGTVSYPGSENWAVTFYCDEKLEIRKRLEAAMAGTFNPFTVQGDLTVPGTESIIQLVLLDDQFTPVGRYRLVGTFITDLGSIEYKVTGSGAIQEIRTTVAYQYWENLLTESDKAQSKQPGGFFGALNTIVQGANAVAQTAGAIGSLGRSIQNVGRAFRR